MELNKPRAPVTDIRKLSFLLLQDLDLAGGNSGLGSCLGFVKPPVLDLAFEEFIQLRSRTSVRTLD